MKQRSATVSVAWTTGDKRTLLFSNMLGEDDDTGGRGRERRREGRFYHLFCPSQNHFAYGRSHTQSATSEEKSCVMNKKLKSCSNQFSQGSVSTFLQDHHLTAVFNTFANHPFVIQIIALMCGNNFDFSFLSNGNNSVPRKRHNLQTEPTRSSIFRSCFGVRFESVDKYPGESREGREEPSFLFLNVSIFVGGHPFG